MNAPDAIGTADELRDVPGYEGLYSVTADGRIWSHARQWRSGRGGETVRRKPGHWMKLHIARHGYPMVVLSQDARQSTKYVHQIVASAWVPNPRGLPQVNHANAIKSDCRSCNLEWCSASENALHARALGLIRKTPAFVAAVRQNIKVANAARLRQIADRKANQQ